MKFGKILRENQKEGWAYINYKGLKKIIASILAERKRGQVDSSDPENDLSSWFKDALMTDIQEVNNFFGKRKTQIEEGVSGSEKYPLYDKLKELHKYAVINYLAVLKIVKKHDKHFDPIREVILKKLVETPLYQAVKTPALFKDLKEKFNCHSRGVPECPICLEPCLTPVPLSCGHEFCWVCLWKGDMENIMSCPLCRKAQTLNPSEMNINDILGGFSDKYFPRTVERKDPVSIRSSAPVGSIQHQEDFNLEKKTVFDEEEVEVEKRTCYAESPPTNFRYNGKIGSIVQLRHELHKDLCGKSFGNIEGSQHLKVNESTRTNRSFSSPATTVFRSQREDDGCIFDLEM